MKDYGYINERKTSKLSDIIKEIKLCDSDGVSITGGEPICRHKRREHYIKAPKKSVSEIII